MIVAQGLEKTFFVHEKEPGLKGSLRSLVRRQKVPRHAVRGVSFEVAAGEILGLVGANGAGKTTVVKILAGIIAPTAGRATVLGYDPWQRDNRLRRQIALIMGQKAQLWWDLPAADGFLLLKEIYQIEPRRFTETLGYLTSVLGVGAELKVQVRRLSLGERMKMELIAALLHSPRVVFLDEPTIGLDLTAQRAIREFLLSYRDDHRPAMILTSHYMEDIERLARRIVILRGGEVVYDGALAAVAERYATSKILIARLADTAAQTGSMPAELKALGRVLAESADEIRIEVPRPRVSEAAARLLEHYQVADLAIEEEDIATIIEAIMQDRARGEATA